jgi:hypothetical protein
MRGERGRPLPFPPGVPGLTARIRASSPRRWPSILPPSSTLTPADRRRASDRSSSVSRIGAPVRSSARSRPRSGRASDRDRRDGKGAHAAVNASAHAAVNASAHAAVNAPGHAAVNAPGHAAVNAPLAGRPATLCEGARSRRRRFSGQRGGYLVGGPARRNWPQARPRRHLLARGCQPAL